MIDAWIERDRGDIGDDIGGVVGPPNGRYSVYTDETPWCAGSDLSLSEAWSLCKSFGVRPEIRSNAHDAKAEWSFEFQRLVGDDSPGMFV